ncbi:MAG TPA: DinB family protein [Crocinitomix sp.]|nr:DinB family protein [Crocinitomix sp.]
MKRIPVETLVKKLSILTAGISNEVKENFSNLTEEQLNWRVNDKSWSIANVFEHLNAFYRYYIPVFNGKIANTRFNHPTETFTSSPMGRAAYRSVKLGKVFNVKRKLKARKEYNPIINDSLKSKHPIEEFLQYQEQFSLLIEKAKKVDLRKTKCPLSLRPVVKLNLGDALLYLAYHTQRHIYQAKHVLDQLKTP